MSKPVTEPIAGPLTRVKICCLADAGELDLAVRLGASAIGLVSWMPSGPGPIGEDVIAALAALAPPGVSSFLLTCLVDVPSIVAQHRRCRTGAIQLVDTLESGSITELKEALPGIKVVQVIHVTGEESLTRARAAAEEADALLLDSGRPDLAIKELGGTGRTHNWEISARIRETSPVPVWLAGGLSPDNVAAAIRTVRPFGVDVCSGVRNGGKLDAARAAAFFEAVRTAA